MKEEMRKAVMVGCWLQVEDVATPVASRVSPTHPLTSPGSPSLQVPRYLLQAPGSPAVGPPLLSISERPTSV